MNQGTRVFEETVRSLCTVDDLEQFFDQWPATGGAFGRRLLVVVGNGGRGTRQGLLSAAFGSKGDIRVFGRTLKSLAAQSANCLGELLPRDDWLVAVSADLVLVPELLPVARLPPDLRRTDIVVLGCNDQDALADPPFCGLFAIRRRALASVQEAVRECARESGIDAERFNPVYKALWWAFLIRPALLNESQWNVASGSNQHPSKTWERLWAYARMWRADRGLLCVPVSASWCNVNTNRDLYELYRASVVSGQSGEHGASARLWKVLNLSEETVLDTELKGNIELTGGARIVGSRIDVGGGGRLIVGANVVIDHSSLSVKVEMGHDALIPDGTVIARCRIEGQLLGRETNGALVGVCSSTGVRFAAEAMQTTIRLRRDVADTAVVPFQWTDNGPVACSVQGLQGRALNAVANLSCFGSAMPWLRDEGAAVVLG